MWGIFSSSREGLVAKDIISHVIDQLGMWHNQKHATAVLYNIVAYPDFTYQDPHLPWRGSAGKMTSFQLGACVWNALQKLSIQYWRDSTILYNNEFELAITEMLGTSSWPATCKSVQSRESTIRDSTFIENILAVKEMVETGITIPEHFTYIQKPCLDQLVRGVWIIEDVLYKLSLKNCSLSTFISSDEVDGLVIVTRTDRFQGHARSTHAQK